MRRNGLNPQGLFALHPLREDPGGCESVDHPKLPARPRLSCVRDPLFGSGFAGLGTFRYLCLRSGHTDSPLEEEGFEPLVPVSGTLFSHLLIKWQRVRPTLNEAL